MDRRPSPLLDPHYFQWCTDLRPGIADSIDLCVRVPVLGTVLA